MPKGESRQAPKPCGQTTCPAQWARINAGAAPRRCIAEPELNVQFTVKDKEAVDAALLQSACANAKAKAEILTKASGVTLGDLVSIDYNWGELHLYSPTHYEMDPPCMARASAAPTAMDIEPDDIDVSDSVTFVWEIR